MQKDNLILPVQITSRIEVGRLLREVEQVDDFLKQATVREPGVAIKMPRISRLLDEFTEVNKMNLLHDENRKQVKSFLTFVKTEAPFLHMSFSVDPSPIFTQKLMTWLRKEIHPLLLLRVGLQPSIGAGCIVRSKNTYFDFSLREFFQKQRQLLLSKLYESVPLDTSKQTSQKVESTNSEVAASEVAVSAKETKEKYSSEAEPSGASTPLSVEATKPTVSAEELQTERG